MAIRVFVCFCAADFAGARLAAVFFRLQVAPRMFVFVFFYFTGNRAAIDVILGGFFFGRLEIFVGFRRIIPDAITVAIAGTIPLAFFFRLLPIGKAFAIGMSAAIG